MKEEMSSDSPFALDTSPIDEETRQIAEKELNETPERVAAATTELRNLLHDATDLHFHDDDQFLLTFLRPCHFYPESALKLVSCYACSFVAHISLFVGGWKTIYYMPYFFGDSFYFLTN